MIGPSHPKKKKKKKTLKQLNNPKIEGDEIVHFSATYIRLPKGRICVVLSNDNQALGEKIKLRVVGTIIQSSSQTTKVELISFIFLKHQIKEFKNELQVW